MHYFIRQDYILTYMQRKICCETPAWFCSFLPQSSDLVLKLAQVTIERNQQQLAQLGDQVLPGFNRAS